MAAPVIAFFQNIGLPETILIGVLAILIFGRRLPEVAAKAAVQVQRFRRGLADLRRETGIDAEIRAARRAVEQSVPRLTDFDEPARARPSSEPVTGPSPERQSGAVPPAPVEKPPAGELPSEPDPQH